MQGGLVQLLKLVFIFNLVNYLIQRNKRFHRGPFS